MQAREKYEEATKTAVAQGLPPTNPIRYAPWHLIYHPLLHFGAFL
jgi:hypothetical protein